MNSQGRTEGKNYQIKAVKAKLKKNIKFLIHFRLTSGDLDSENVTFRKVSIGEIGCKLTESNSFFLEIGIELSHLGSYKVNFLPKTIYSSGSYYENLN